MAINNASIVLSITVAGGTGPFTAAATFDYRFLILITVVSQSGIGISGKV